jgi:poly-gamma-glutamate system protein
VFEPLRPGVRRGIADYRWLAAVGCAAAGVFLVVPTSIAPMERGSGSARRPVASLVARLDERAAGAERAMRDGEAALRAAKTAAGVVPEAGVDASGVIGSELTPLVTTLGSLEAKRISANPVWAAVLTRQMAAAGIGPGDVIAAGFSGSFPGLNLAVAAAAHALDAELIAISSVTASTWGANQPGFTWPEMECLLAPAIIPRASIAVTAGGDGDMARDLESDGRRMAVSIRDDAARRLGAAALTPADFDDAIRQRMSAYRRAANGRPIVLYVNVGGTSASLGESPAVLTLKSGFIRPGPFDRSERRGVMARFAEQGVRVLTLLNIRDLAVRWGIPLAVAGG